MKKVLVFGFVFLFLAMAIAVNAQAQVQGPIDPATGQPAWFRDTAGVQVQLCNQGDGAGGPPCHGLELFDPALGVVQGNILSAMYYAAGHVELFPDGTKVVFSASIALEGDPANPLTPPILLNEVFLRIDLNDPVAADTTFTFTDPWSPAANTVTVLAGQKRGIFTGGPVTRFLSNGTGGCLGTAFLGDAVTEAPLAGAGPGAGGTTLTFSGGDGTYDFTSTNFSVEGILFAPLVPPGQTVAVERAAITKAGAKGTGVLFVQSTVGDAAQITLVGGTPPAAPIPMVHDAANGRFFGIYPLGNVTGQVAVNFTISTAGIPDVVDFPALMTDSVTIKSATYASKTGTLTISASSSVPGSKANPGAVLTVEGVDALGNVVQGNIGTMARGKLAVKGMLVPPSYVRVKSNLGGSMTVPLTVR